MGKSFSDTKGDDQPVTLEIKDCPACEQCTLEKYEVCVVAPYCPALIDLCQFIGR